MSVEMIADDFLGAEYEVPESSGGGGRYLKLKKGTTHFRVVSQKAVKGWEYWTEDNKAKRLSAKPEGTPVDIRMGDDNKPERVRHFWAFVVWDYEAKSLKVLQITQKTIQSALIALVKDKDFGHPRNYDLKISRSGEGLETEYNVMPLHKPFPMEAQTEITAHPIYLEALMYGADPFSAESAKYVPNVVSTFTEVASTENFDRIAALLKMLGTPANEAKTIRQGLLGKKHPKDYTPKEMSLLQDALLIDWAKQFEGWQHDNHRVNAYHKFVEGLDGVPTDEELFILWKEECEIRVDGMISDASDAKESELTVDPEAEPNPF